MTKLERKKKVWIGLIQTRLTGDFRLNMKRAMAKVKEAAKKGAQVICLPELYRTKYFPADERNTVKKLAETIQGESVSAFADLARELGVVIIVPIFEVFGDKYFNTAAVIDADGTVLGTYRKNHIPHDPFFYEKSYFSEGNLGYRVFKTSYLNLGVLICFDQWFPEAARVNALQGADVIFYPTAIGYLEGDPLSYDSWVNAWETIQRAHAIANGVHVAVVNRIGQEGKIKFWGDSFVCDAFGQIIKRANQSTEEVLVADVDLSMNKFIQEGWGFFRNRRVETYGLLTSKVFDQTPRELGYTMPAEWERHEATWLAWPYDLDSFPKIKQVEKTYLKIIKALSDGEDVNLLVKDSKAQASIKTMLKRNNIDLKKINLFVRDYADVWFRDYGPIFVVNKDKKQLAMTKWIFNAWGEKYRELLKDNQIPYFICEKTQIPLFKPGIVLEGGSIDVNGKGTLLTTEQCLLAKSRNPHLSRAAIEDYLKNYLGASNIIWLKSGIKGDDTDGHIDDIARFVNPTTVLCAYENNHKDSNYSVLKENFEILLGAKDQDGKKLNVIKMPMPTSLSRFVGGENTRLPMSYLNFYISNKTVLVPTFRDKNDKEALAILSNAFQKRKIVGIDSSELIYGLGSIHCITQQQPAIEEF